MHKPWLFQLLLIGGVLLLSMGLARADSLEKGGSSFAPDPQHPRPEIVILRAVPPRIGYRPLNPNGGNDVQGVNISPGVVQGTGSVSTAVLDDMQLAAGNAGSGGSIGQGIANLVRNGLTQSLGGGAVLAPGGTPGSAGAQQAGAISGASIAGQIGSAMSSMGHLPH